MGGFNRESNASAGMAFVGFECDVALCGFSRASGLGGYTKVA